jgi:leader peptidase (prepilin peptidase)/N-methyltransferase
MLQIYIVAILLGGIAGLWLEKLTAYLIEKRISEPIDSKFPKSYFNTLIWIVFNLFSWVAIVYLNGVSPSTLELILILSACIVLSVVDIVIKKIPNELILFLLITGIVFLFINNKIVTINLNLLGFVAGFVLFFIPSLIGKAAGWGDVKFAAVVGFCLGIYNFFASMIIMGALVVPYMIYILITGKGNLKTKIAYGPFMALGFVIVMMLTIFNNKYNLFDFVVFLK